MSGEGRPQPRHSGVHGRSGWSADRRSVQADAHGRGMARIIRWHQYGRGHVRRMRKGLVPSARRASAANQSVRGRVRRRNRLEGCFGGRRAHRGRHPLSDVGRIGAFARASTRPRAAFLLAGRGAGDAKHGERPHSFGPPRPVLRPRGTTMSRGGTKKSRLRA